MKRWLPFFIGLMALTVDAFSTETPILPQVQVIPWNGHKAAISLTFDDSDPSHLDVAVPELNKRKMHGTFFLIANRTDRKDDWRKLIAEGHELANHTLDHKHGTELDPEGEKSQIAGAQNVLQKEFGVPINTFAYPFTEVTPGLRGWLEKTHLLARGGYGNGAYIMKPELEPDWMNISARATMSNLRFEDFKLPSGGNVVGYKTWIDDDFDQGGWMVFMVHGLEGTLSGWQPISREVFQQILDYLQSKDIWVGNFREVGTYFMAQKMFERSTTSDSGVQKTWNWQLPDSFPNDTVLKVRLDGQAQKNLEMVQGKKRIEPDASGVYAVPAAGKSLTLRIVPKK